MAKLMEEVVNDLNAVMQSGLAAKLTAIQTEHADGVTLDPIVEFIVGEREARDYPALWVLGQESEREIEEGFNQLGFSLGFFRHRVLIVVALIDPDDPERLRRKVYRYARAVHEVLADNESYVEGTSDWVRARILSDSFTGVFEFAQETIFRQDAYIFVEVSRYD